MKFILGLVIGTIAYHSIAGVEIVRIRNINTYTCDPVMGQMDAN